MKDRKETNAGGAFDLADRKLSSKSRSPKNTMIVLGATALALVASLSIPQLVGSSASAATDEGFGMISLTTDSDGGKVFQGSAGFAGSNAAPGTPETPGTPEVPAIPAITKFPTPTFLSCGFEPETTEEGRVSRIGKSVASIPAISGLDTKDYRIEWQASFPGVSPFNTLNKVAAYDLDGNRHVTRDIGWSVMVDEELGIRNPYTRDVEERYRIVSTDANSKIEASDWAVATHKWSADAQDFVSCDF